MPPTDRSLRRGMRERARCPTVPDPATSTTPRCTRRYEDRSADARRRSRCLRRGWDTRARSQPRATLAVDTYGTVAQSAARSSSVLSSSVAAACAGDATITECAVRRSFPIVSRHSLASRTHSRTGASRRTALAGSRASIADTSSPIPPRNALKTPSPEDGAVAGALKSVPASAADRNRGATADMDRCSTSPA